MTIERLGDFQVDVMDAWFRRNDVIVPLALLCAAAHPLDPSTLCRRLDGHSGTHCADGTDPWAETEEDRT